jgi:hypothetical protein
MFKISGTQKSGFCRCGRHFPYEGVIVKQGDFTETQWEILRAEPKLRVETATGNEAADAASDDRQRKITDSIETLKAEDFQKDGKPKLDALNDLLGDELGKIKGGERDAAWDAIVEQGFKAPAVE